MTRDLTKLLADYVDNKLDPETEIEIDGLILLYVDGELDPERAAEIKAVMDSNPAVEASISRSMRAAKTVQEQLVPAYEAFKLPPDPELDKSLADMIADPNAWGQEPDEDEQAKVVPLQAPKRDEQPPAPPPAFVQPSWGMMAASIAALLAIGGGIYLYDLQGDERREQQIATLDAEVRQIIEERAAESDQLTRQVTALGIQLNEATAARDDVTSRLAEAKAAIEGLNADEAELSAELAAATEEATAAEAARDSLEQQLASLDAETRQTIEARVIERDELTRQLTALENRLDDASRARDDVTSQLAEAKAAVDGLNAEQAELSAELAAATEEITTAEAARDKLEQQLASLDAETRQVTEALVTERDALTGHVTTLEARLEAAVTTRDALDTQLIDARTAIETLNAERDRTASEVAALETKMTGLQRELAAVVVAQETVQAQLDAEIEQGRERVASLEDDLNDARGQIAGLNQSSGLLLAETERLRKQGSWLNQVVGYHRGYAGTMREVEVSAEEQRKKQALTKWLGSTFGGPFTVPDLEGLTFVGGRVFFVNGVPTGQIAYHDSEGRLTGFCFTPGPVGATTELSAGQDDDLNLLYWEKEGLRYVLLGWTDFKQLTPLAAQLRQTYGEDT